MYKQLIDPITNEVKVGSILRTADMAYIPFDPANTDYQQFLKDIKEGVELLDAEGVTMSAEQATQFVKELP